MGIGTVRAASEWVNLDPGGTHQLRFVKADGKVIGAAIRHIVFGTTPENKTWCEIGLVQWEPWFGYRPLFTVTSGLGEHISLSPNIVCEICGDKGFIENGTWRASIHETEITAMTVLEDVDEDVDGIYQPSVRRDLGDKVPEEEEGADNKIYDFLGGGPDPDLEAILREEIDRGYQTKIDTEAARRSLRKDILDEVAGYILGDRNIAYGPPHIDFQRTADMLTALWGHRLVPGKAIEAQDIATVLILVKLSRIQWSPQKRDSWADIVGYGACGYEAYVNTHELEVEE